MISSRWNINLVIVLSALHGCIVPARRCFPKTLHFLCATRAPFRRAPSGALSDSTVRLPMMEINAHLSKKETLSLARSSHRSSLYRDIASLRDTLWKSQRNVLRNGGALYVHAQCYARSIDPRFLASQSWFTTAPGIRTSERTLLSESRYYPGKRRMNYDAQAFRIHERACIIITILGRCHWRKPGSTLLIVSRNMHFHASAKEDEESCNNEITLRCSRKEIEAKSDNKIREKKWNYYDKPAAWDELFPECVSSRKRPSCQCLSALRKVEIKLHQSRTRIISPESCALGLNFMKY